MFKPIKIGSSDKFIWFICFYWLLIDSINGFFWNENIIIPLSQAIKTFLLGTVIYKLLRNKIVAISLFLLLLYFNINYISSAFVDYPVTGTIQHLSKMLLTILLFIYFKKCMINWPYSIFEEYAYKVFKYGVIILFANVFLGLFGIGYHTYVTGDYGYKGFFSSGNEMGGLVVVLVPVLLYWAYFSVSRWKYIMTTIICIIFGFLLSTKSVILIVVFFSVYIPFAYNDNRRIKRKIIVISLILVVLGAYVVIEHFDRSSSNFMVELFFRYDKGGLLYLLLSARNEFVLDQFEIFNLSPVYQHLLGMGCKSGNIDTVEMDYFDILFYYGYIGLFIMIVLTIALFRLLSIYKSNNKFIKTIRMSDIIMVLMATIAGHILFSSTAGLYIALINSFIFSTKEYPLIGIKKQTQVPI